ncbi:MAG: Na/Pi cotransporter family protein [Defluviitaleaceae bacterium]|nr:Na/Pi cotransporter family protein [Defluviitaleaceae bacterium]
MDFFDVLTLLGGLGLFLYGMSQMSDGLKKLAGGKMQSILEKLTSNRVKAMLLGAGVTAVIQSSSATTVMVVGFVNSGIMKLSQVIGIIMGANIGTTITGWVLSLSGLQGDSFIIRMLKPASLAFVLALVGAILIVFLNKGKKPLIGKILIGLAILFIGMGFMSQSTAGLKDSAAFGNFIAVLTNPFFGVLLGFCMTAVVQSSSATLGILQALAISTGIPFNVVLPIILGENIGTCMTAFLSSIGANRNARRTAMVHFFFNAIGTSIALPAVYITQSLVNGGAGFWFWEMDVRPEHIAIIHSCFNVTFAFAFLPFTQLFEKLVMFVVHDKAEDDSADSVNTLTKMLDVRFLLTPALALEQSKKAVYIMANIAAKNVKLATGLLSDFSTQSSDIILENEVKLNVLAERISNYLVKIKNLPASEDKSVSKFLHSVRDIERIGDHAENITAAFAHLKDNGIDLSQASHTEIEILVKAVNDILEATTGLFEKGDIKSAQKIEPLEEAIDFLRDNFKERQMSRIKAGIDSIESGVVYNDILTDLERVADHCSNIALYIIEELYEKDGIKFEMQEYMRKALESSEFLGMYNGHKERYLGMC